MPKLSGSQVAQAATWDMSSVDSEIVLPEQEM